MYSLVVRNIRFPLEVLGHTCSGEYSGQFRQSIGRRRVESVGNYLLEGPEFPLRKIVKVQQLKLDCSCKSNISYLFLTAMLLFMSTHKVTQE